MNTSERQLFYTLVGHKIRTAREQAEMFQSALAEEAEISRVSLANIESGKQKASLHIIWDLAEVLNTDPKSLLPDLNEIKTQDSDHVTGAIEYSKKNTSKNISEKDEVLNFIKYTIST